MKRNAVQKSLAASRQCTSSCSSSDVRDSATTGLRTSSTSSLQPSDYHIFGRLKEALHGHGFASDEEVKEAVHTCLREQPKSFFSAGIQKLVERYNKCIVLQGDYVEK
jgi:hypothetical protein